MTPAPHRTSQAVEELLKILKTAPRKGRDVATIDLYEDSIRSLSGIAEKFQRMEEALTEVCEYLREEGGEARTVAENAIAFDPLSVP